MSEDELVSSFCAIANCDPDRARFFLGASNGELQAALDTYFVDPTGASLDSDVLHEVPLPDSEPLAQPSVPVEQPPRPAPRQEKSRFGTLDALKSDDSDSDDETNRHYAGGSEHSGQLIKGNKDKDKVKVGDVFKSAREHGAEDVEEHGSQPKSQLGAFSGGGYKLGNEAGTSQAVPAVQRHSGPPPDQRNTITFWKGGFSVDDGPLRKLEDAENKEFISAVMKGEIPQELVRSARGAEVHVNMIDKRTEDYVPPKVVIRPFSGSGFRLGSPSPNVISEIRSPTNPPAPAPAVSVDEAAPITSIQIRLADGTRLVSKFNHSHTIGDVRSFIDLSRPGGPVSYTLMTTFPNKQLSDNTLSLKDAGLLNACIVQKKT